MAAQDLGYSLPAFLHVLPISKTWNMSGSQLRTSILSTTSILSFVSPTLGLYFSSTIYTLWNTYLITGYGILHPQKALALHMVLFMKVILSLLQHLSISSFLEPAWCLIVPSLMTYNLGNGVIVGHMMLQLGRSRISQVIFPPLVSFEKINDFGGLDRLARHIVPGLYESMQVIASIFGMRIRIEQIWLSLTAILVVLHQLGYNGIGILLEVTNTFRVWYSLRIVLWPTTSPDYRKICENVFSFWILAEMIAMTGNIPVIGPFMLSYGKVMAIITSLATVIGLTGYSSTDGYSRAIVKLFFKVS